MKHFTLIAGALIAVSTIQPASANHFSHTANGDKQQTTTTANTSKHTNKLRVAARNESAAVWCPVTQNVFGWDIDEEQWIHEDTYTTEYTPAGKPRIDVIENLIEETTTRTTYEYDANGNVIRSTTEKLTDGGEYQVTSRKETTYGDPKLPGLITANREWMLIGDELKLIGNNFNRIITRNDAGNITKVEIETFYDEKFDVTKRMEISYGADGKATEIKCSDLILDYANNTYVWMDAEHFSDITWENTDGQIYDVSTLFYGPNRIKTAAFASEVDDYTITATYDNDDYVTVATGIIEGIEATRTATVKFPDTYGSQHNLEEYTYDEDGEEYYEAYLMHFTYDKWGYLTLDEYLDVTDPDEPIIWSKQVGTCEYDPDHGYPLTYTVTEFDFDTEEMANRIRIEFSDYIDASAGVDNVAADADSATPVYYNLQGLRVNNPANGIYIRIAGGKASKVAL